MGCVQAPGDSALAFWVGDFYWMESANVMLESHDVKAKPESEMSEYHYDKTQLLGE